MGDLKGNPRAPRPTGKLLTLLAQRALNGSIHDRSAFLEACRECGYAAARRFGRRHHGAEDSAQDAAIVVQQLLDMTPPRVQPESVRAPITPNPRGRNS